MYNKVKIYLLLIIIILWGSLLKGHAQKFESKIPKGQLIPVPQHETFKKVTTTPVSTIFYENFETGATTWSVNGMWEIGSPTSGPNSGYNSANCAATNLAGNYDNNLDIWLISPPISLPSIGPNSNLSLSFQEWYEIESGYDYGYTMISTDGGTNWTTLDMRDGTTNALWKHTLIDISNYNGNTILIAFLFTSDGSITYSGWYIDDVAIELTRPEPLTVNITSLNTLENFFVFMNVTVDTFGVGIPTLTQSNFQVYENGIIQSDQFLVLPPDTGGGARVTDIIFLMDNSGSMGDEINAVSNNVSDFVNALQNSGIDFALGLCRFGAFENSGYPILENNGQLTQDVNYFLNNLWSLNVTSGRFEPGWDAIYASANGFSFRPGAQRVFILITDESPTGNGNIGNYSYNDALNILQQNAITLFALIQLDQNSIQDYGTLAEATNGQYFDIFSNFNDIFNFISTSVSNTYVIRYRSSEPSCNGIERNVVVEVSYQGNVASDSASYIPCSVPVINRTQATRDLHKQPWVEGTSFDIEVEVIDNYPPFVQDVTLYYRTTGSSTYQSVSMNLVGNNIYRGTIPGYYVHTPGVDYYITATDGQNTVSDPITNPTTGPYQIAILPNIAPVIHHTPPINYTPGQAIPIAAEVIDSTNYVQSVHLFYRKIGQLVFQHVEMTNSGINTYSAEIPANDVTDVGVEYYIWAIDNFGVGTYKGTVTNPIVIRSPLSYADEKDQLISAFRNIHRYEVAEDEAEAFVQEIRSKIAAGTLTNKDLEALIRLILVEESAWNVSPFADALAEITSEATTQILISLTIELIFKNLSNLLKPFKNIPILDNTYNSVDNFSKQFGHFINHIQRRFGSLVVDKLVPVLIRIGFSSNQAQNLSEKIAKRIFDYIIDKIREKLEENEFNLEQPIVQNIYSNLYYGNGISIPTDNGDYFQVAGTANILKRAVTEAKNQNFVEGDVSSITRAIRNIKTPNMIHKNQRTINRIRTEINAAEIFDNIQLAFIIATAVVGVIAGIAACGVTGGVSCIISAISGLTIWGALSTLLTFFEAEKIALYSIASAEGFYRLEIELPQDLEETRAIAFPPLEEPSRIHKRNLTSPLVTNVPLHWADSLAFYTSKTSQELQSLRTFLANSEWEKADSSLSHIYLDVYQLNKMEQICNAVLYTYHSYNRDTVSSSLPQDSLVIQVSSYSSASKVALAFAQLAASHALINKTTGAQLDTILTILDQAIQRLNQEASPYYQMFYNYQMMGYQAPPIIAIIDYGINETTDGYEVYCRIKNISDVEVNDVYARIEPGENADPTLHIQAATNTLLKLSPQQEVTVRWKVTTFSAQPSLLFNISIEPLNFPGNFHGDAVQIFKISSLTSPNTSQPLADENIYAYPNPFNPTVHQRVSFRFQLAEAGEVTIKIYNINNNLVKTILDHQFMPAQTELVVRWDGKNEKGELVANGVYFFVIESSTGKKAIGKLAILR